MKFKHAYLILFLFVSTAVFSATITIDGETIEDIINDIKSRLTATESDIVSNQQSINDHEDRITILEQGSPTNNKPISDAGPNQTVDINTLTSLNGSGSFDPDGDPITYLWDLSVPSGSSSTLSSITVVNPTFTPDLVGVYTACLVVNDGALPSDQDCATVTAQDSGPPPPTTDAFIYIRTPRAVAATDNNTGLECSPIDWPTGTCVGYWDITSHVFEVANITGSGTSTGSHPRHAAPGEVIIKKEDGTKVKVFSCLDGVTGIKNPAGGVVANIPPNSPCVPNEVSVHPDGTKAIFRVTHATALVNFSKSPVQQLGSSLVKTNIYTADISDLDNIQITELYHPGNGIVRLSPIFLPNNDIMYCSNEQGNKSPNYSRNGANREDPYQMHIVDPDGSNPRLVGQHHISGSCLSLHLHPSGEVYYSNQPGFMRKLNGHDNGSAQNQASVKNAFNIARIKWDGSEWQAVDGFHHTGVAQRGVGFDKDGNILFTSYYRTNMFGAGTIDLIPEVAKGEEGHHPAWLRSQPISTADKIRRKFSVVDDLGRFADWANSGDVPSTRHPDNIGYQGRLRSATTLPSGDIIATHCDGHCMYRTNIQRTFSESRPKLCDSTTEGSAWLKIVRFTQIPSQTCRDLEILESDPDWNSYDARSIASYQSLYGKTPSLTLTNTTPSNNVCWFRTADARFYESSDLFEYPFANQSTIGLGGYPDTTADWSRWMSTTMSHYGNGPSEVFSPLHTYELTDYIFSLEGKSRPVRTDIVGLRFHKVFPRTSSTDTFGNGNQTYFGLKSALMGDVPIVNSDGSLWAQIPCDVPFVHAGYNANGDVVVRNQVIMSARSGTHVAQAGGGENIECKGCHLHSSEFQPDARGFDTTQAYAAGSPSASVGDATTSNILTFVDDVYPILDAKCSSCHTSGGTAPNLPTDRIGKAPSYRVTTCDSSTTTYSAFFYDPEQKCASLPLMKKQTSTSLRSPYPSKYVNMMYPVESPFFWVLKNQRLDARQESFVDFDQEFVEYPEHGTPGVGLLTTAEYNLIREWAETGYLYSK